MNLIQKFQTFSVLVYNYNRTAYHHNGYPGGLVSMNSLRYWVLRILTSGVNIPLALVPVITTEFQ